MHPDTATSERGSTRRNLYGCIAVVAVVGAIAIGLPALDRALPDGRAVAAGSRVTVGLGVSLTAAPYTVLDLTRTAPALNRVVLSVRGNRMVVEADEYSGDLAGLAARQRRKIRSNPGYEASQREHPTRTDGGVGGVQGSYSTPGRIGMYAVFVHGGTGVRISVAGTQADLRRDYNSLLAMVRSVRFGAA